jgi:hypothetical protein
LVDLLVWTRTKVTNDLIGEFDWNMKFHANLLDWCCVC